VKPVMVRKGQERSDKGTHRLPPAETSIDPSRLHERLDALPGIERLREAGAGLPAYLVGGAVRDLLLGRSRADVDVAIEGDVDELARRLGGEVRKHPRFSTATVRVPGLEVDIATTRAESYPHPGALPVVRPAPLLEDLARRDFTINAMALPLGVPTALIDRHGGRADLEAGQLRVLHAASFRDDPTRALRAARYASRYGLELEPGTARLLHDADLSTVSGDRVEAELRRLAAEPEPRRGFELASRWGLLALPEGAGELIERVAELVTREPWRGVVAAPDAVLAAARGRRAEEARTLAAAVPTQPSEAARLARGHCGVVLALGRALGGEWLDRYVAEWRDVRLEIDGNDLIAEGVEQGPAVGRGLAAALDAKLDGEAAGRTDELRVALAAAGKGERW
jgi:tRNA nucleotidyltransferase (CCA-adding enzyme)